MTEYHKIETLYERDEQTHKLKSPLILKNRIYGCVNPWLWTEKIDGTNIRCTWDGSRVVFGGRTDAANLPAKLVDWLRAEIAPDDLIQAFPDTTPESPVILYGEGYGAGIQKGGGDYSPEQRFILFDVRVGQWWLSDENMRDVAAKVGIQAVPSHGEMSLSHATEMVQAGIPSVLSEGRRMAEGLVGRPIEALFDKKGARLIVKLKTKDFA